MKIFNSSTKKLWLPIVLGAGLAGMIQSAYAEGTGSDSQNTNRAMESDQGIKQSPPFHEVDKNGDHYVTLKKLILSRWYRKYFFKSFLMLELIENPLLQHVWLSF